MVSYIRENQTYFYRLAYQYVGDRDLAMDLVQDAVVKALRHWESLREPEAVRSWFYRILVRECLSFLRQNRRVIYLAEPPEQVQSSGESALEDREALRQAIDRLSPNQDRGAAAFLRGDAAERDRGDHRDQSQHGEEPPVQGAEEIAGEFAGGMI